MKSAIISFLFFFIAGSGFAQTKTETIKVAGECGMCKKKIESAAKKGGASYAVWNTETKELTVKYNSASSDLAKIEKSVAGAGYDTPGYKASDEDYKKLDECCQYERTSSEKTSCCNDKKCTEEKCMKDGKCEKDMACCKDGKCDDKDCCKKS